MFNNIGGKIKGLAQTVCCLGIIVSIIYGAILMSEDDDLIPVALLIMILGSLISWIGSFMTYGFGQLIENTDILVRNTYTNNPSNSPKDSTDEKIATLIKWKNDGLITEEEYNKKMESLV